MHSGPFVRSAASLFSLELDLDVAARRVSERLLCVVVEAAVLQTVARGGEAESTMGSTEGSFWVLLRKLLVAKEAGTAKDGKEGRLVLPRKQS